jgi:branched-chain amino acid transport system ATP-binding protein
MSEILTLEGVQTFYAKSHILHEVSLTAQTGEIVTLLGRNGAGKTTTLRSIMGLTPARQGTIRLFGKDITRLSPFQIAAMGVGYVPEGRRVFANLTVEENLLVPVSSGAVRWTLARIYGLFPRLEERRASKARTLSGGEQEMLAIARALLVNPRLLILDEPSQGLAPLIVRDVFRTIREMRAEGITVLLVEQNVRAAVNVAERAFVMDDGRIVWSGAAAEFAADEDRVRALAGAGSTAGTHAS